MLILKTLVVLRSDWSVAFTVTRVDKKIKRDVEREVLDFVASESRMGPP